MGGEARVTRRQLVIGGLASAALAGIPGARGAARAAARPDDAFDVCVVGSGFAGIHLALRTSAAGLRTAVLEAGPAISDGSSLPQPPFECSGEIDYPVNATRVIAVGGTSHRWAGVVNRLRPSDFRMRSEFGRAVDWPIGYGELEPYYCEAEQALQVQGRAPVEGAEPPRECAYPSVIANPFHPPRLSHGGRPLRFFRVARAMRDGRTLRLVDDEIPRFAASPLGTLLSSHAVARLISRDGRRVEHALARTADGGERRIRARCFVVAAGVVESARLLLLSRSEAHPNGLGNDHDLLGRTFVEHPNLEIRCRGLGLGPLDPGSYRTYDFADAARREGLNAYHYQLGAGPRWITWTLQPELEPRPENRIALSASERDRFGDPIPDLRFGYSERDRRTIAHARIFHTRVAQRLGTGPRGTDPIRRWRAHPAGTCRMGFDEGTGVVDRDQRVMGTDNLYVSGACVFPTAGTANPTLTVVATTLRLADHLIERLSG